VETAISAPAGSPALTIRASLGLSPESADPGVLLDVDIGNPKELYHVEDPCATGSYDVEAGGFTGIWAHAHHNEYVDGQGVVPNVHRFTGFQRGEGFLHARKQYVRALTGLADGVSITETTTIDLRHRPLKLSDKLAR
jgi:hypothetical protein